LNHSKTNIEFVTRRSRWLQRMVRLPRGPW
jgi:hypothetical protein